MISANKLQTYFADRVLYEQKPVTADIFLTDYCNEKCSYCRYGHETGRYMNFEKFCEVQGRLKGLGVRGFILTGGGEPTINPDFEKITNYLEMIGAEYGINTNFVKYVDCNPRFLKVSIDEGDPERYKDIRGVDKLNTVINNVKRYKAEGHNETRLGVQAVAYDVEQIKRFYKCVCDIELDYIQVRPLELPIGRKHPEYEDILALIEDLQRQDSRVYASYKFKAVDEIPKSCPAYWSAICVNVNGDVPYCCHRHNEVVGNIMDEDILEKWARYCPDMSKCEAPCRLTGANAAVREVINNKHLIRDIAFI